MSGQFCFNIAWNKHCPLVDNVFNTAVDLMERFNSFVSSNFNDLACEARCFTWFSSHSPVNTEHSQRHSELEVQVIKRCRSTLMRVLSSWMRHIYTAGMRLSPLLLGEIPVCFCGFSLNNQGVQIMMLLFCIRWVSFCLFLTSEMRRNWIDMQAKESSKRWPVLSVKEQLFSSWLCSNTSCKSACCSLRMKLLQVGITRQGESTDTGH